jgi:hypothetical protein
MDYPQRKAALRITLPLGVLCCFSWGFSSLPGDAAAQKYSGPRTDGTFSRSVAAGAPATNWAARLRLAGQPQPDHVVIVMEENHSYTEIIQGGAAPYITNTLIPQGALFTNYFAQYNPSEQNYLEILSGSDQGIGNGDPNPAPGSPFTAANWGGQLPSKGFTFKGYSEGLPSTGYSGPDTGKWVYRHCPWIAFQGTGLNQIPPANNVDFSSFPTDFTTLPTVCMVTPNLDNDMHDGTIQQGDQWLQTNIDAYAQWAKSNNSLLIVVWDEDDGSQNNQVAMLMVGQIVQAGVQDTQTLNHDSLCQLICDMYGIPPMGGAIGATSITGIWSTTVPPTVVTPASASPSTVPGLTTSLSVLGGDSNFGEATLLYTWSATGPAAVTFNPNGTNAAKNTTATFSAAGTYTLTCTILNVSGLTKTSVTMVTVLQTLTSVAVVPANVSVVTNGTKQFAASTRDQFGNAMSSQPAFTWSVSGGGAIDTTGLFTAGGSAGGPFNVTAMGGGLSGTAKVTVTSTVPVLTTIQVSPSTALVSPNGTRQFSAVGIDQFMNPMSPQPAFGWSVSGGGAISATGLFTAGGTAGGPFNVQAASGPIMGTAVVTVGVPVVAGSGGGGGGGGACGSMGLDLLAPGMILAFLRRWSRRSSRS